MSQLSRLISILTLLRSKRILTATELSKKFDVSIRTIYRDIRKLEESNVPIVTIEGKGYSLMDGYAIPPIQFTETEANALITAQYLVDKTNDSSLSINYRDALVKMKSVFRTPVQIKGELLNSKTGVFLTQADKVSSNALSEIQLAITNFSVIEINYQKNEDSPISFRKIEPCAIFSSQNNWVLLAWCHLRNDYRAFRIDRIKHFKILLESFNDHNFDLRSYFLSCQDFDMNP